MNVKEYAEKNGITLDQAYEETGLQYWNQKVTNSNQKKSSSGASTKKAKPSSKSTLKEARALRGKLWDKTKEFLEFVEEHKSQIPAEYERIKKYIK